MTKKTSAPAIDVSVIVVSYNGYFWLKTTLESFQTQVLSKSQYRWEVIVVDNGSSDETLTKLPADFPWVKLIPLSQNTGFSAGNNVGLKQARGRYAMLLNADVELTAESNFDALVRYADEHPHVGIITPKVMLSTGQLDWACHRGEPTLWAAATYFSGLAKLWPNSIWFSQYHLSYLDLDQPHQVQACSGAAMLVRQSGIDRVGLLDEQFFFYAEDLDWCRRFREAGFEVMYMPTAQVIHHKYKSGLSSQSAAVRRKTRVYFYDTMLQYFDKYYRSVYPEWVRSLVKMVLTLKKGGI